MKRTGRLPTIIALILLAVSLTVGLLLIQKTPNLFVRAGPQNTPQQIKITNITDTSFAVSWFTDAPSPTTLKYGSGSNLDLSLAEDGSKTLHYLQVKGLSPDQMYSFRIISGGKTFNDNGQPFRIKTAPLITAANPANNLAYGVILDSTGNPVSNILVYLSYPDLSPQSALTTSSGNWAISLHLTRSENLQNWFSDTPNLGEIFVQAGSLGSATAAITSQNDTPVPPITLGQQHDFRQVSASPPPADRTEAAPAKSRFTLDTPSITIANPQADEKITTTRPEFWGTAPASTNLTLEINSPAVITQQLTTSPTGSWSWTPPADLAPGDHSLSIALPDGTEVIRRFVILAAGSEDLPAFTATPSGQTITASPTPSDSSRTTMPATTAGIPQSGNLTPTFIVSMLGIGLIILGLIVYGRSQSANLYH
ncbi:MAG: Ig-like domain-containing protein [Candidatus Shapirobacteria bacterium]